MICVNLAHVLRLAQYLSSSPENTPLEGSNYEPDLQFLQNGPAERTRGMAQQRGSPTATPYGVGIFKKQTPQASFI